LKINNLVDVCQNLADSGKRVIVAGLDQDYRAKPFEPMPQLLAIAEYATVACHCGIHNKDTGGLCNLRSPCKQNSQNF